MFHRVKTLALLEITNEMHKNIDKNLLKGIIFLDLKTESAKGSLLYRGFVLRNIIPFEIK